MHLGRKRKVLVKKDNMQSLKSLADRIYVISNGMGVMGVMGGMGKPTTSSSGLNVAVDYERWGARRKMVFSPTREELIEPLVFWADRYRSFFHFPPFYSIAEAMLLTYV
jgi:hypothetical protein